MVEIERDIEKIFATVCEMFLTEGMADAAKILQMANFSIQETGYDNWDGGTTIYTVYIEIDPIEFAKLGSKKETIEEKISNRFKDVVDQYSDDWFSIKISPRLSEKQGWRLPGTEISKSTRQSIIDNLKIEAIDWSGRLGEVEFLERIFDLKTLPSHDHRFDNAARDIWQHRVNNPHDWTDDWIFDDERFDLIRGPADVFLKFLCEVVHPIVRPNRDESLRLVNQFNTQLRSEGWEIIEESLIAGRSHFVAKQIKNSTNISVSRAHSVAESLSSGWMQKEIQRLENAVAVDPALAIGTAKDLVETCCKSILNNRGIKYSKKADIRELTKALTKELSLVPEDIPDRVKGAKAIKLILHNLSALTHYLAELRGLYGSGHGRDGGHRSLEARHARLAVGAAITFIDFITETHRKRTQVETNGK